MGWQSPTARYVRDFYKAFNQQPTPTLARRILSEEMAELSEALYEPERDHLSIEDHSKEHYRTAIIKEMADVLYTLYGFADAYGIDLDEALLRVHQSNMTKLDESSSPILRDDGKIMKSSLYKEPDLRGL